MSVLGPADVRNGSLAEVEERIMDVRLRPSLVPAKRSQAQAVDVNGPGGGALEGLNPSQAQAAPTSTGPNP